MDNAEDIYIKNKMLNNKELEQKKDVLRSKMRRLQVVLTGKCNLRCIMCDRYLNPRGITLPRRHIEQIIDFFPYLDTLEWQGGEVFLVDYFEDLFIEASRYSSHLLQTINTNGLLITERWAELIAKTNVKIIFSIDSIEKDTYEHIRKGAKFRDLIERIEVLQDARERCNKTEAIDLINIVIMRSNYRELFKFVDFANKYKFSGLNFMYMIGDSAPNENIISPVDEEAIDYLRKTMPEIKERARSSGIFVKCELDPLLFDNTLHNCNKNFYPSDDANSLFCHMPWMSLFIDIGGVVYPECLCRKAIGNIFKERLEEIWNSKSMQLYRQKIMEENLEDWCSTNCLKGFVNKEFLQS